MNAKRKRSRLPAKPSRLIRVALDHLAEVERDPCYQVNMDIWHSGTDPSSSEDPCAVCLAGAVMAKRLKAPIAESRWPSHFDDVDRRRLSALDHFRRGHVDAGLYLLGVPDRRVAPIYSKADDRSLTSVPRYEDDRAGFKRKLRRMAAFFEAHGL